MKNTLTVTVKYFASIREAVGHNTEQIKTSAVTLGDLRRELIRRGGAYATCLDDGYRTKTLRMAMNQEMRDDAALLLDGCEIAFFPPVTGG